MVKQFFTSLFFFSIILSQAVASEAQAPGIMGFLRGHTWEFFMAWFNLIVLLVLLWKFVFEKLLFPALGEGLTDIETRLSTEETERRELAEKIEGLQVRLSQMDQQRDETLGEDKTRAEKIKIEIMEQARIDERKVLDQAEKDSQTYYLEKVNEIKNGFFSKVARSFEEDAGSASSQGMVQSYNKELVQALGGSHAK